MRRHAKIICLVLSAIGMAIAPFLGSELLSPFGLNEIDSHILKNLRIPRVLLCFGIGGTLAILGAVYQVLFRNVLAEPYVLGVSSGVTLGVAGAEIFLLSLPGSSISLMCGAVGSGALTGLLLWLGARRFGRAPERLVLFGMSIQFVLSSSLFLILSYHSQQMGGGSLRWLFGQIPWIDGKGLFLFTVGVVPCLLFLVLWSRRLDALSLGDSIARTLGVPPVKSRNIFLFVTSVLVTIVVTTAGTIGFVGLVIPHAVRLVFRPSESRFLMGFGFLLGGIFLVYADVLSRTLAPPFEFPIGILTSLLGGPVFLWLLTRRET
jgi:iron complex transport system permease protein